MNTNPAQELKRESHESDAERRGTKIENGKEEVRQKGKMGGKPLIKKKERKNGSVEAKLKTSVLLAVCLIPKYMQ